MTQALVEGMKERLAAMESERDHLLALIALYDPSLVVSTLPRQSLPPKSDAAPTRRGAVTEAIPNGPTDRLLAVARETPGLGFADLVRRATVGVVTKSKHPAQSVGSTLSTMIKRGSIRRVDGKHYVGK